MKLLSQLMQARRKVLLVGPPGIAKTARILAAAQDAGFDVVTVRASMSERVDIGGAFVPDVKAGICKVLPLDWLHRLKNTKRPTVNFLDDMGQSPMDVQASLMKLFDPGELPENVLIWGATNRPGDKAGVTALCEPLRSRFDVAFSIATPESSTSNTATELQPWHAMDGLTPHGELEDWCQWAYTQNAAPEIIAWHQASSGRTLYQWKPHADPAMRMPDFRSWGTVIHLWNNGLRSLHVLSAAIGKPAAVEFLAFAELSTKLPSPDEIRMDPHGAMIPDEPSALYLITTMLISAAQPTDAGPFCNYLVRLPRVYGALLGRGLMKQLGAKLSGQKEWNRWYRENQELFI